MQNSHDHDDDESRINQNLVSLDDALLDVNVGILDTVSVHHLAILDEQPVLRALQNKTIHQEIQIILVLVLVSLVKFRQQEKNNEIYLSNGIPLQIRV